jgi:hypothetical protein
MLKLNHKKIKKVSNAIETNPKINKFREDYCPVALRCAVIYFLIHEMSMVNLMYQL